MIELLKKFESKTPEIVFEWNDPESDAIGWVVINSLRGGAAGGGTRMRSGLSKSEVEALAKTMEIKFTVSGPPIGGAKSGINFDPNDPRKEEVLRRWFAVVKPLLKYYYGTGGDLNVDEINEVIPITEDNGIWHPQEGVFNGHFQPTEAQKVNRIGQLRHGVKKILEDERYSPDINKKFTVADMITGYGVAESVKHYYKLWGGQLIGKKAIIQGWGNVGAAAAYYLSKEGVLINGIIDRSGGIIVKDGLGAKEVKDLFINRKGNQLHSDLQRPFDEINEEIWDLQSSIFIPAAASRLVTKEQVERLVASGTEVVACGANVPFKDNEIFFGPTGEYADASISVIPDFIANCGMARVFAYLMGKNVKMEDYDIFNDVSETIYNAMHDAHQINPGTTNISRTSFEIALNHLL